MGSDLNSFYKKISSDNNNLLLWVINDLQQIIGYINDNSLKDKMNNKEINLNEEEGPQEKIQSVSFQNDTHKEIPQKNKKYEIRLGKKKHRTEIQDNNEKDEPSSFIWLDLNKIRKINDNNPAYDILNLQENDFQYNENHYD